MLVCEESVLKVLCCRVAGWTGARCEVDVDECALGLPAEPEEEEEGPGGGAGAGNATLGPCRHGGRCEQRCAAATDYHCFCNDGWGGKNCTQQVVSEESAGGADRSSTVLIAVGAALVLVGAVGALLAALGAQARRKRATRGTYSPSGQVSTATRERR
ncbi:Crumbs [Operophtera brumata]|uniref:Crumbs n=1 Tax=Operophtera brumata TaxID=104452 RepID=A0A0L7KVN5_OPEBR|nr:Crumbs [Operophtera brumata]